LSKRLAFNLNTDGIYGKNYTTCRDDMTPEMMAQVVMANYDPAFTSIMQSGDLIVGGFNFGTGSSREQAVTALQAAMIALVIAGSFSQTYLRNAFNNGYACVESPDLVRAMKASFDQRVKAGDKTIVTGDTLTLDFARAVATWRGTEYGFAALGTTVQESVAFLVASIDAWLHRRLHPLATRNPGARPKRNPCSTNCSPEQTFSIMELTNHIRQHRARLDMTQDDLAVRVGVRRQTILAIEKGRYVPSALLAFLIAGALGMRVDELFALVPEQETAWESDPE
jgi:3-isopropylmalate dehydratase small subunit/DNA-binding XRE family transcriptional regulator